MFELKKVGFCNKIATITNFSKWFEKLLYVQVAQSIVYEENLS